MCGITTLDAEVHEGLDVSEEAVLFLLKNRESSKPQPLDKYKVGLTAGLPLFVDTQKVLDRHGLGIGRRPPTASERSPEPCASSSSSAPRSSTGLHGGRGRVGSHR